MSCRMLDVDKAESPAQAKRFAEANSDAIREHFYDMTAALLVPFAPYCQPALPGEAADLAAEPGPLPVFDPATFLETLPLHNVPRALHKRLGSQVMPCPGTLLMPQALCLPPKVLQQQRGGAHLILQDSLANQKQPNTPSAIVPQPDRQERAQVSRCTQDVVLVDATVMLQTFSAYNDCCCPHFAVPEALQGLTERPAHEASASGSSSCCLLAGLKMSC